MDPCHAAEALANSWYMKAQLGATIFTCFLGMTLIFWFSKRHVSLFTGYISHNQKDNSVCSQN